MLGSHPHVVDLVGFHYQQAPVMLVTEFCALGDLRSFLLSMAPQCQPSAAGKWPSDALLSRSGVVDFCFQLASAVAFLHSKMIVHRDLAARNVLVQSTQVCLLCVSVCVPPPPPP